MKTASSFQLPQSEPKTNKPPTMHRFSSVRVTVPHSQSYIAMKPMLPSSEVVRIIKEKIHHLHVFLSTRLGSISKCANYFFKRSYMVFWSNPLLVQLIYFMSISFLGFLVLKSLKPQHTKGPSNLDLIFTSVSTLTVSSMATVEMEDFSDQQLWVLIILMILGGEVFTSIPGLLFKKAKASTDDILQKRLPPTSRDIELSDAVKRLEDIHSEATISHNQVQESKDMKRIFCNILASVVAGYFVVGIVCSSLVVTIYIWLDSDAKYLLKSKSINIWTFSIFTAVSSFANCGFTPVNDNMVMFRKNSSLLLLVIPQILAGNTLFTPLLRLSIWTLGKIRSREEYAYILQHPEETGYRHLQQQKTAVNLALTAVGVIVLQVMFLCYFGWHSIPLEGLNWFQKLVCLLFQSVNTRHAGEAVIDISTLSPPILVLFALIMYFPSDYLCDDQTTGNKEENSSSSTLWNKFIINKPVCLTIFIILACITEMKSMSLDPLNFNIFSIVFEVISAYGNVGYSLGYSCERLLKPDATCKAVSYGFVGRWSDEGKLIIIMVMFLGRFRRFRLKGGKP